MKCRSSYITAFLLGFILFFVGLPPIHAQSPRQVVIIDIPRLQLADLNENYPHLTQLIAGGSTGLATIPTIHPVHTAQVYLYFNCNTYLKTPPEGYKIFDASEKFSNIHAGEAYENYTGESINPVNAVNIDLRKIIRLNPNVDLSNLGSVGRILHRHHLKTAAIGNADTDRPMRFGAALVMDPDGKIDWGAVGAETIQKNPRFPYGIQTSSPRIMQYYRSFKNKADIIVITLGDLERLENSRDYLTQPRESYYRNKILLRYDLLIASLEKETDNKSTLQLVFTCLQPAAVQIRNNTMTPVTLKGPNFPAGLLYSTNTRKSGMVTYNDLRMTIINYLCSTEPFDSFSTIRSKPGNWSTLKKTEYSLAQNYSLRWPILTAFAMMLIGLSLFMTVGIILNFRKRTLIRIADVYIFLLTLPATFLLEALFNPLNWLSIGFLTLTMSGIIFFGAFYFAKKDLKKTLGLISFITLLIVAIDGFFGGYCESKSFLGYTAVSGKRYYGIGNEYMGVFMGSYIVFISFYLDKFKKWKPQSLWLFLIAFSLLFLHPGFGADVGGGITVIIGLGITHFLWLQKPFRYRESLLLIGLLFLSLAALGLWDSGLQPHSSSHFGQLVQNVGENGLRSFVSIILRKAEMSLWLIRYTPLTIGLIAILLAVPLLYHHPPRPFKLFINRNPIISAGFTGLNITALIGFLVNDSGIVAAATMYMFGLMMIFVTLIDNVQQYQMEPPIPENKINSYL